MMTQLKSSRSTGVAAAAFAGLLTLLLASAPRVAMAATSIALDPATATLQVGETLTVTIQIDTDGAGIRGGAALLQYDTAVFTVAADNSGIAVAPGSPFQLSPPPHVGGGEVAVPFTKPDFVPVPYAGAIATVQFLAIAPSPGSAVGFEPTLSRFSPAGVAPVLGPGLYTVAAPSSPTATPSPTTTPTPTATITPTPNCADCFPLLGDPGDYIIGDREGVGDNNFNYADAFSVDAIASDDSLSSVSLLKWSYWTVDGTIRINGVDPLPAADPLLALDPSNSAPDHRIDTNDFDTGNPGQDATPRTVTLRNAALSPSNAGPFTDPGGQGIITSQTRTVTLYASDGTTVGSRSFVVYTSNNTSDSVSGIDPLQPIRDDDFTLDTTGWVFAALSGEGTGTTATGLCVSVPLTGENYAGWVYVTPPGTSNGYITLVDEAVWKLRTYVASSEGPAGTSPLFVIDYVNNYFSPQFEQISPATYGGTHLILDAENGANAPGARSLGVGRDFYDLYLSPPAMLLPQWKGDVDQPFSAFAIQEDTINDMNLVLRVIDLDSSGVASNNDSGTICLTRFVIDRANIFGLWSPSDTPVFAPPITADLYSPSTFDQVEDIAETQSTGHISGGRAHYKLATGDEEIGSRKTLLPYDQTLPVNASFNTRLYPIVWTTDKLYLYEVQGEAEGPSDLDPPDIIDFIGFVPTIEYLVDHLTTRGYPNSGALDNHMFRAGSMRLPANVGSAVQRYVALYYTQNRTLSLGTDDPARIAPRFTVSNFGMRVGSATDGLMNYALTAMKAYDLGNP